MKIDYRKRCITDALVHGHKCQIIRYGVSTIEANTGLDAPAWRDMQDYEELLAARTIPHEPSKERVYATPSTLQTYRYPLGLRTPYEIGSGKSPQATEADQRRAWRDYQGWKTR